MKRLMILGASIGQLAMIKTAKRMGYELAVVDYNKDAMAIPYADKFFQASTNDIDAVVKIAKEYKPDGITTIQTDMPVRTIAAVCEALNLKGLSPETAVKATDKEKMIEAFKEKKVASPWYYVCTGIDDVKQIIDIITFPCIIKPVDNSGSRGVSKVDNSEELYQAVGYSKDNSKNGRIIIEEYMEGPEVSVEILMMAGQSQVLAVTDKLTTGAPHFVEVGHNEQSMLGEETVKRIKELAGEAMRAVGITDGPGHVEIIATKDGPKVVELGGRLGGDFITSDLVPLSTGVDMMAATIEISCGGVPDVTAKFDKGSAIRFITANEGIIHSISGLDEAQKIEGIVKVELIRNIGDYVPPLKSSLDRVGYIMAQAENAEIAVQLCEEAMKKISVCTIAKE